MKWSRRNGMVGLVALAGLSIVQWARESGVLLPPVVEVFLGIAPNLFAALAITFVGLGALADQELEPDARSAWSRFYVVAAVSGVGLVVWEFIQRTSARFVFDEADIGATIIGLILSAIIFRALAPRA